MVGQLTKRSGNGLRPKWTSPISLRREFEDVINRMWGGDDADWLSGDANTPTMDISETNDAYRAKLDLPGVAADDIDVQVNGNLLTVTCERNEETEEKGRTYHRTERSFGRSARSVTLGCDIKEDQVAANLDSGVLTIELPKAEKNKPRKVKIEG